MKYCVYKHTSPNGKVYIGQTCQKPENRWKHGKGYLNNKYFYHAIQKYGWDNFKHEILYSDLSKEEADILEVKMISQYNSTNPKYGFNMENGGYGKGKHSAETLIKISENRKGIQAWNKGISMSAEQKKMISQKCKGRESAFKGKHHNIVSRKKLSESQSQNMKAVLCVETNTLYKSLTEAEQKTGISRKNISKVCRKVTYNGRRSLTAGGYHWQFIDFKNDR